MVPSPTGGRSGRLIVVSNRVAPIDESKGIPGGLAVGVLAALRDSGGIWFGWSGRTTPHPAAGPAITQSQGITYATIDLSPRDYHGYYNGFANRTLWPLFHYRPSLTDFSRDNLDAYRRVNGRFAERLAELVRPADCIWVHDYHLIPLGAALRRFGLANRAGFFLHTPFPAPELLTVLPNHGELVESLLHYDVIGFQTDADLQAFRDYIEREAGGRVHQDGHVSAFGRMAFAGAFPIGIDTETCALLARQAEQSKQTQRLMRQLAHRDLIIGVDRLDYSKGLVERFLAFERLLELFPRRRDRTVLMQIAPPTRSEVPEYQEIRRSLERISGHINGRFGEPDWTPIHYLNRSFTRKVLAGYHRISRVGLVTPLRDGMNLVAKEYVASQREQDPGVLVLSRFAGAARELDAAILVNPYDTDGVAEALERALTMPLDERRERWRAMMSRISRQDVSAWRESFLGMLRAAPSPDRASPRVRVRTSATV